ncbi:hypothetical protein ACJIZ3_012996 [Penstemon smallii]|uniref:Transcription factor CBF/NF-Y/archaeal histone domain-containing protein n=1 Tax=Penstemon smallii TaxID=265156 RepID=A0ABD3UNP8_9LAMI
MPIANVIKIMRKILPSHAKIADDAKETIQECVTEFIGFITSEANGRCHRDYRITITPEDVISTMGTLGFDNYVEPLTIYLNKIRNQESECNSLQHFPFVKRNVRFVQPEPQVTRVRPSLPRDYVPAPAYPLYPMPSPPRGYAPTQPTSYPFNPMPSPQRGYAPAPYTYPFGPNNYDTGIGLPRMNNDIHDFGGQGGSSSNNLEFDPFMQFK